MQQNLNSHYLSHSIFVAIALSNSFSNPSLDSFQYSLPRLSQIQIEALLTLLGSSTSMAVSVCLCIFLPACSLPACLPACLSLSVYLSCSDIPLLLPPSQLPSQMCTHSVTESSLCFSCQLRQPLLPPLQQLQWRQGCR
jgi:hypothetical protein